MKLGVKTHRGLTTLIVAALLLSGWMINIPPGKAAEQNQPELPLIRNEEHLQQLLTSCEYAQIWDRSNLKSAQTAEAAAPNVGLDNGGTEYSSTNVQVEGVDEADLVKTDGSFIYQVNQDRVFIIKADPDGRMSMVSTLQYDQTGFNPQELYVDNDCLIVIGSYSQPMPVYSPEKSLNTSIYRPVRSFSSTRVMIYDIHDKEQIAKIREIEVSGNYLSSRKIDASFYLLTNQYIDYYHVQQGDIETPQWRDSLLGGQMVKEKVANIRYFPGCISPNYLTVASLDLDKPSEPAQISSYLGSGEEVYASLRNIFVAVQNRTYYPEIKWGYQYPESNTQVYKFALEPGQIKYAGTGQVPGRIINQFSMDEHQDYFRIATTRDTVWSGDQYSSSNNIYVLDQNLQIKGRVENIAPGEKIYSTRFMGDRAYMVTFKQVDPFFVIDLKDPFNPQILGKLKLPGYSEYLHPYDENHIIGFGKNTIETKGWNGQSQAFYLGLKISLFDVTEVSQPIEISQALIGDRGTYSEILNNHKALLYSADRKLMAFPVTVMEVSNNMVSTGPAVPAYGSFAFQGLYVYNIDLAQGIQYRGRITHLNSADYKKAGDVWPGNDKNINRALYIGNYLYTLSPALVKSHSLSDLADRQALNLPPAAHHQPAYPDYPIVF